MINRRKLEGTLTGLIWIFIIYSISLFLLVSNNYSVANNIYFTFFNVLFLLFYLLFSIISKKNVWLYFLLEGIIIYISAFFMSDTYPVSTALYPLLLGQAILVINSKRWVLISIYFILFLIVSVITVPKVDLLMFFMIFIPLNIIIVSYAFNLNKLALSKIELEKTLNELENAYDDLEYLTLKNERQRMARDLHDILAQGLTGIKMQLEVIDIYLQNNKAVQAVNIVRKSKEDVSNTLATSRMVIDNLHHLNNGNDIDLQDRIKNQIEKFKANTLLKFNFQYSSNHTIDNEIADQLEYIISEVLFNIVQHAKAKHVRIKIIDNFEKIIITINDDGIGFEREKYKIGHYGLRVMEERTKSINGNLYINTSKDIGTTVVIEIPI